MPAEDVSVDDVSGDVEEAPGAGDGAACEFEELEGADCDCAVISVPARKRIRVRARREAVIIKKAPYIPEHDYGRKGGCAKERGDFEI
jgi:hypothetical protein